MKPDKLKTYILQIILLVILFFALFVPNIINNRILAVIMLVVALVVTKLIKKRKVESINKKQVIVILLSSAVVYLVGFYLLGLYFSYYESPVKIGLWALDRYIFPLTIIIICSEKIRNVFIAQKAKMSGKLIFIAMVVIDIILYAGVYDITELADALAIIGYIIFASISCNLLYNYISIRYGMWPVVGYRLITVLYAYIIPITPDIFIFFRSFLRMIYPYFIYLILEGIYGKSNISVTSMINRRKRIISGTLLFILTVIIIMLISCQFTYGILVVASESMTGAINKGDAIVFKKYEEQSIKTGQIILYNKDNVRIIHRVIEIKNVGGEKRYITKGDINSEADDPYVTKDQIIGIYKFRIPNLGYPSLWLRQAFSK